MRRIAAFSLCVLIMLCILAGCNGVQAECKEISGSGLQDSPYVNWVGRCEYAATDGCMYTYYAATGYTVSFTGTCLSASYRATRTASEVNRPCFAVSIDGESIRSGKTFFLTEEEQTVVVAENLPYGQHTVTVLKRSEPENALTAVTALSTDGAFVETEESPTLKFQILGGSGITGHGCLGKPGEGWTTANSSPFESFGYLAAEHFGAQTQFVSASGMGLVWSYRNVAPLTEAYDAVGLIAQYDDSGSTRAVSATYTGWNHNAWKPDAIIVNIGGNDWNSYVSELSGAQRRAAEEEFQDAVTKFLNKLLTLYPQTIVVWTASNLSGGSGGAAAEAIQNTFQSDRVLLVEIESAKNGADNHADSATHQANAQRIIAALEQAGFSAK